MQEEVQAQRRRYPRFPFHRMASIVYDSGECPGALLDASFNGALFEASSRLSSPLSDCVLIIPFSRDPEEAIRLQAEVAYRRGMHVGLHWEHIDAESSMKLRRLVEMNLGTLRLLERPLLSLIWPAVNQPSGNQLSGNQPSGNRPSGQQPPGKQPPELNGDQAG